MEPEPKSSEMEDNDEHIFIIEDSENEEKIDCLVPAIASEINLDHSTRRIIHEKNEVALKDHPASRLFLSNLNFNTVTTPTSPITPTNQNPPLYFGDDNFGPPFESAYTRTQIQVAKHKIEKQRKKIKSLKGIVNRLKTKVNTLNMLFKYLRDNDLVTLNGHSVMKAFVKEQ